MKHIPYTAIVRLIAVGILLVAGCGCLLAQMPIKHSIKEPLPPDSVDMELYSKKHFWRAAAMVGGMDVGLWAFDRFVLDMPCSHISLNSWQANLKKGFVWDNDNLGTNMFMHPYNGNLYFNGARSNGFNYWQSGLFAVAGSAVWELFMENEYPSTNDIIATPIGGMAIGEMAWRISDAILNDKTSGWERFEREAAVFLINPMRGLTRIINGDAWRHRATKGRQYGRPAIGIEAGLGAKVIEFKHDRHGAAKVGPTLNINISYGNRYEVRSPKPYDYFLVRAQLNFMTKQPVLSRLNIQGRLLGKELWPEHPLHVNIGLYQHFDYYDSDTISNTLKKCPYKLGVPASVGAGIMVNDTLPSRASFDAYLHANAVILGGVLSDYYKLDNRNYNLGSGFSIKAGLHWIWDGDRFSITAQHQFYRIFTFKGYPKGTDLSKVDEKTLNAQGDHSQASFGVTEVRAEYRIWRRMYLGVDLTHYFRVTNYRDFPTVKSSCFSQALSISYKL